jgi:hypothetical protein
LAVKVLGLLFLLVNCSSCSLLAACCTCWELGTAIWELGSYLRLSAFIRGQLPLLLLFNCLLPAAYCELLFWELGTAIWELGSYLRLSAFIRGQLPLLLLFNCLLSAAYCLLLFSSRLN